MTKQKALPATKAKTPSKLTKTFEEELIAYLDKADEQIKSEKVNKGVRAVNAVKFLCGCLDNLKKSGKVTLLAKLVERSEFAPLMRMIIANIVVNMKIKGRGKNLSITFDGSKKPQWIGPMLKALEEFDDGVTRIDDSDVKETFGIPMGDQEKINKAYDTIKALSKRKIDGDPLVNLLPQDIRDALDKLITMVQPATPNELAGIDESKIVPKPVGNGLTLDTPKAE